MARNNSSSPLSSPSESIFDDDIPSQSPPKTSQDGPKIMEQLVKLEQEQKEPEQAQSLETRESEIRDPETGDPQTINPETGDPEAGDHETRDHETRNPGSQDQEMPPQAEQEVGDCTISLRSGNSEEPEPKRRKVTAPHKASPKPKPNAYTPAAPKKTPRQKKWEPPQVYTNSNSPLTQADLRAILLLPEAWDVLTEEEKKEVLGKFPDNTHILEPGTANARPNTTSLRNDDDFRHDCARYVENIEHGKHDEDWLYQAWVAHEKHKRGDFDAFLKKCFEQDWGVKLPEEEVEVGQDGDETQHNDQQAPAEGSMDVDPEQPGQPQPIDDTIFQVTDGSDTQGPDQYQELDPPADAAVKTVTAPAYTPRRRSARSRQATRQHGQANQLSPSVTPDSGSDNITVDQASASTSNQANNSITITPVTLPRAAIRSSIPVTTTAINGTHGGSSVENAHPNQPATTVTESQPEAVAVANGA